MTERIKTTKEIWELFGSGSNGEDQWVFLSMLKDYIRMRKKLVTKGKDAWNELHNFEILLKEK